MPDKRERISFVFPVYNEKENIETLYRQVKEACAQVDADYEMVFVDDGSSDNSLDIVKKLRKEDPRVVFISLSRNFGHQNAIFAGLSYVSGDAAITMDADLQHPPSLIPKMIEKWREGAEVVYTTKESANVGFVKNIILKAGYWFMSKISGLKLDFGQSDFRLIDEKVLKVILDMSEYHKFLRGEICWIGFKQVGLPYDVEQRYKGSPKFSLKGRYAMALDGIFSFGKYPLHLVMILSLVVLLLSSIYIFMIFVIWVLKIIGVVDLPMPPGWTALAVGIFILGSIQLMSIGILSEYVGRIYEQTKGRPVFIVREKETNKKD